MMNKSSQSLKTILIALQGCGASTHCVTNLDLVVTLPLPLSQTNEG